MTHRPTPDLPALAAHLRLTALALVVELAEWMGFGPLAAALRRRMARDLQQLEHFATGVVGLTAIRMLPTLPPARRGRGRRPFNAPRGFVRVAGRERGMRALQRRLFPRERDLSARLARFDAVLADIAASAARLVRHIERVPPASRLLPVAPPAQGRAALAGVDACANDSS